MTIMARKIEAVERRLAKVMARDPKVRDALTPAFNAIHGAYLAVNEGKIYEAEQFVQEFNRLMKEHRKCLH